MVLRVLRISMRRSPNAEQQTGHREARQSTRMRRIDPMLQRASPHSVRSDPVLFDGALRGGKAGLVGYGKGTLRHCRVLLVSSRRIIIIIRYGWP